MQPCLRMCIRRGVALMPAASPSRTRLRRPFDQVADWTYRIAFVAFLTTAIFFIGCGAAPLAGVTAAYRDSGTTIALNSACNQQGTYYGGGSSGVAGQPAPCPHVYTPVCGGNGQTFINACYAGCFGADESDAATSYVLETAHAEGRGLTLVALVAVLVVMHGAGMVPVCARAWVRRTARWLRTRATAGAGVAPCRCSCSGSVPCCSLRSWYAHGTRLAASRGVGVGGAQAPSTAR